jgi:hypothetical protein
MKPIPLAFGLLAIWSLTTAGMCVHDTPPGAVVTQVVDVPVPVPCDPKVSPRPAYPDTDAALRGAADDVQRMLLWAGRKVRDGYIGELEGGLAACKAQPPPH